MLTELSCTDGEDVELWIPDVWMGCRPANIDDCACTLFESAETG